MISAGQFVMVESPAMVDFIYVPQIETFDYEVDYGYVDDAYLDNNVIPYAYVDDESYEVAYPNYVEVPCPEGEICAAADQDTYQITEFKGNIDDILGPEDQITNIDRAGGNSTARRSSPHAYLQRITHPANPTEPASVETVDRRIARDIVENFESRYGTRVGHISVADVSIQELVAGIADRQVMSGLMAASPFMSRSPDDTKEYSDLVAKVLDVIPQGGEHTLIDLGCGNGVPSIRALVRSGLYDHVKLIGVDIDPQNVATTIANIRATGLKRGSLVVFDDMTHFLWGRPIGPGDVIVSNPPYLPWPTGFMNDISLPVSGGPAGTTYLKQMLLSPMPGGTYVGLRWSSLSNPVEMIPIIETLYDVVSLDTSVTPFGFYTSRERAYLEIQSAKGLAVYFSGENGEDSYTYYSIILRRR